MQRLTLSQEGGESERAVTWPLLFCMRSSSVTPDSWWHHTVTTSRCAHHWSILSHFYSAWNGGQRSQANLHYLHQTSSLWMWCDMIMLETHAHVITQFEMTSDLSCMLLHHEVSVALLLVLLYQLLSSLQMNKALILWSSHQPVIFIEEVWSDEQSGICQHLGSLGREFLL